MMTACYTTRDVLDKMRTYCCVSHVTDHSEMCLAAIQLLDIVPAACISHVSSLWVVPIRPWIFKDVNQCREGQVHAIKSSEASATDILLPLFALENVRYGRWDGSLPSHVKLAKVAEDAVKAYLLSNIKYNICAYRPYLAYPSSTVDGVPSSVVD
jgi:hypothetical protein